MRACFLLGVALSFAVAVAISAASARDAHTAATIECIEAKTAGKADEEIDVDTVVLECMEEARPFVVPPIPRLPS